MSDNLTLEQMKANRKLWVEALRSGKYKQGKGQLTRGNSYCCLGVLARCAGVKKKDLAAEETLQRFPQVQNWVGLKSPAGWYERANGSLGLANENDKGASFSEIADIIESEPEGLFIDRARIGEPSP